MVLGLKVNVHSGFVTVQHAFAPVKASLDFFTFLFKKKSVKERLFEDLRYESEFCANGQTDGEWFAVLLRFAWEAQIGLLSSSNTRDLWVSDQRPGGLQTPQHTKHRGEGKQTGPPVPGAPQ